MTMTSASQILKNKHISRVNNNFVDPSAIPIRKIKDTRYYTDNEYIKNGYMSMFPKYVTLFYGVLAMHAHSKEQNCWPARDKAIMDGTGIKNKNTISKAIKILEAHNLIYVIHSKGRIPNMYYLLDVSQWKPPNSIIIDTIKSIRKSEATVSKGDQQQYQKSPSNSITADTRSHISKSDNEINKKNSNKKERDLTLEGLRKTRNMYIQQGKITSSDAR
jgi:hypothetical protein